MMHIKNAIYTYTHCSATLAGLGEKKRQTEEALRRSQEQLAEQRRQEEALKNKVCVFVSVFWVCECCCVVLYAIPGLSALCCGTTL